MSYIKTILAKNIKYYRNKCKMTQEELATRSNLHRTYIDSIENQHRNVSIENIDSIAKALNVDTFLLLKINRGVIYD